MYTMFKTIQRGKRSDIVLSDNNTHFEASAVKDNILHVFVEITTTCETRKTYNSN